MRARAALPPALLGAVLAACGSEPVRRSESLGGPVVRRGDQEPHLVRERAAELRRVPLDFEGVRHLRLEGFDGDVVVRASARAEPELRANLRTVARTRRLAERMLEGVHVDGDHEGEDFVLRLELPELDRPYATNSSYELTVPPGIRVRVSDGSGDVEVEGAFLSCSVDTSFGNVRVAGIRGPLTVRSDSGDVRVEEVAGTKLVVDSVHGDVTVRDVSARRLEASSRSGDVAFERVRADALVAGTHHGQVDVLASEGGEVRLVAGESRLELEAAGGSFPPRLHAGAGEVTCVGGGGELEVRTRSARVEVLGFAGEALVDTSHGNVSLEGVFRRVRADSGSGKIVVTAREGSAVERSWSVASDLGNVVVALPASFSCRLEARASVGTIHSDFPVAVSDARARDGLYGLLNGGGERVRVESRSGRIQIRHAE